MPNRRRICAAFALVALLDACGGAPSPAPRDGGDVLQEASVRAGDAVIRATAVPTRSLGDAVARQYGIERDDKTVLLLVAVRRGEEGHETALPARIDATATDLLGKRQRIELREIRSGGFIDYAGSVRVIPPDTLRFDLRIVPEGRPAATLQFNRDVFPQP